MMDITVNHGVIPGKKSTDWPIGAIPHKVVVPNSDWTPYLVRPEKQYFQNFDTMACVSFATNNAMEMQIKQQTGREVNFSDRFLAKKSGTTNQGNWVYIVLDTVRNVGVVHEEEWPKPPEPTNFNAYYGDIPQFVTDRAKAQFKDKYDLQYVYLPDHSAASVKKELQHAPLLITIPGHEVVGVVVGIDNSTLTILDTYEFSPNYTRKVPLSSVTDIYKAVLTVKEQKESMELINDNGTYFLVGDLGKIGIADEDAKNILKSISSKESTGSTAHLPEKAVFEKSNASLTWKG